MLDLEDIKRTHKSDSQIIGDAFLPRGKAILKLRVAYRQRGLLLDEVEWLRQEYDKKKAWAEKLEQILDAVDKMQQAALKL